MDMKKKLEDAYAPDKNSRKEKVVIGLFGTDSLVTAFLLKIQKYDLIAVTIMNSWDDFTSDQEGTFSCHVSSSRLEMLKEFCHKLSIPLQIVKSPPEFKEEVIEPWMGDKIQGMRPKSCWNCHDLRMRILHEKMLESGAKRMATGHYAKLFQHENHHSVFVHTSSDEHHDQSAFLSRLPHEILSSLMLPLSDLSRKEVLKLAENFGVKEVSKKIEVHQCLKLTPEILEILEKKIPKKMISEGEITSLDGTQNYGNHEGIHHFTLGETPENKDLVRQTKGVVSGYYYPEKRLKISPTDYFQRYKFMLVNCHLSEEVSWMEPLKGYVLFDETTAVECWLFPKTLSSVSIELTEKFKLIPGQVVSVVRKKGKNAKVYLTGEIQMIAETPEESEGEENVLKVDPVLDF